VHPKVQTGSLELAWRADAVGLTCSPQTAFTGSASPPPDYLVRLKPVFGAKPLLVTRAAVQVDGKQPLFLAEQASFTRRLLQNCYWLDAAIVAYPELLGSGTGEPARDVALRVVENDRPALRAWQSVLHWKRVKHLTVPLTEAAAAPENAPVN
jgi:hypothetical protein